MKRKILVTTALPYANGSIHLGHVLEGIQADIFVRFQKSQGNECYLFCADDTHGTPVMIAAKKENSTPEDMIARIQKEHYEDLTSFLIEYNNYYSTNSKENQFYSNTIYNELKKKGHISSHEIEQTYCNHDKMFLPDRFVKGMCPKCKAKDQYGDSCDVCGSSYNPKDVIEPYCSLCGNTPILKNSDHLFFKLPDFQKQLEDWVSTPKRLSEGASKKLKEWFHTGLQEWDISRDGPYFGFPIPDEDNKYFYVWLDAPIGYMASSQNYFEKDQSKFDQFWKSGDGEIIHFVGKDILYFHGLFWPAMLMGSGFKTPNRLHVHGFITVNGEKMSKSRGTFLTAKDYKEHLDVEHFRFYMAARLGSGLEDVDFHFEDFISRVNSDLIGNLVNLLSRVSTSILDKLDRRLGEPDEEGLGILTAIQKTQQEISIHYESMNYSKVIREITSLGDILNQYINNRQPWALVKTDIEATRKVVTTAIQGAYYLFTYLEPILPNMSKLVFDMMGNSDSKGFARLKDQLYNKTIQPYKNLSQRVDEAKVKIIMSQFQSQEDSKKVLSKEEPKQNPAQDQKKENYITIDDLAKIEIRVGEILEAQPVEGADKLLQLTVSLGPLGNRNVFAGIKSSYKPEELKGLRVAVVANLKPRTMKFGVSEAMILAAGKEGNLSVFTPNRDAQPGDLLK